MSKSEKSTAAELKLRYGIAEEALAEQLWTSDGKINVSVLEIFSELAPSGFEADFICDAIELIVDLLGRGASRRQIAREVLQEIRGESVEHSATELTSSCFYDSEQTEGISSELVKEHEPQFVCVWPFSGTTTALVETSIPSPSLRFSDRFFGSSTVPNSQALNIPGPPKLHDRADIINLYRWWPFEDERSKKPYAQTTASLVDRLAHGTFLRRYGLLALCARCNEASIPFPDVIPEMRVNEAGGNEIRRSQEVSDVSLVFVPRSFPTMESRLDDRSRGMSEPPMAEWDAFE